MSENSKLVNCFDERETCYMLKGKQLDDIWIKARIGRATSSILGVMLGHSDFQKFDDDFILSSILKVKEKKYDLIQEERMKWGIQREPIIRDKYSQFLNKDLQEVSLAIWKEDTRFAGSLDFEIVEKDGTSFEGGEIKAPIKMYRKMIQYHEARKARRIPDSEFYCRCRTEKELSHIFKSHYDQMIANAVITNKKYMHYVVEDGKTYELYYDIIPVDLDYWSDMKEKCSKLLERVDEMMLKYNISRMQIIE